MKPEVFSRSFLSALRSLSAAVGILVLAGTGAAADGRSSGVPVSVGEVRDAISSELRGRGVPGDLLPALEDIDLPAAVPASIRHTLRVVSFCWDADLKHAQFRLECREPGDCLPFLAYMRPKSSYPTSHFTTQACRNVANTRAARSSARKPLVRAGDRATVVFHGSQMRLTSVVTCLDRGAEGDVIRVRNQDGQIFRARVSSATLLEALPQ